MIVVIGCWDPGDWDYELFDDIGAAVEVADRWATGDLDQQAHATIVVADITPPELVDDDWSWWDYDGPVTTLWHRDDWGGGRCCWCEREATTLLCTADPACHIHTDQYRHTYRATEPADR